MALPKDIIAELLMRLPVKSLMRFKCVSNEWNEFISDGDFRRRYKSLQKSKGNAPAGFICHNNDSEYGILNLPDLNFLYPCIKYSIPWSTVNFLYASSENYVEKEEAKSLGYLEKNGFVISASKGLLLLGQNHESLSVYDLVSNKSVDIPPRTILTCRGGTQPVDICLGFKCEEEKSGKLCYTLLSIATNAVKFRGSGISYYMEIYTSETGKWRKSILEFETYIEFEFTHTAKVIRGVFHWFETSQNQIVAYDDDMEKTTLIKLPPFTNLRQVNKRRLRELEGTEDGSLQFINIDNNNNNTVMMLNVWILGRRSYLDEDDIVVASRWSLVHSLNLWDIGAFCRNLKQKSPRVIGVDHVDVNIIYLDIAGHIYTYNHHKKVLFASSKQLASPMRVFIPFEWPAWPCL